MNISKWAAFTGLAVACGSSLATAQGENHASLFNITLGATLSVPPCEIFHSQLGYSKPVQSDTLCGSPDPVQADGSQHYRVFFPKKQHPNFVPGIFDSFDVIVREGTVQEIRVFTTGLDTQDQVLSDLTQKFGKPALTTTSEAQNLMGAKFNTTQAHWIVRTDIVAFIGAMRVDGGQILVQTATQAEIERKKTESSAGLKL